MLRFLSFLAFLTLTSTVFASSFTDTEYSLYRDSIETLSGEGVISGYGDGKFGGENTITRAEILKILFKSKKLEPTPTGTSCFEDVSKTTWYHPYACGGARLGVVKGFDDGTFGPNKPVTVLEALAMSLRLYEIAPENSTPWYTSYQRLADDMKLLDSSSYGLTTPMTRGKATELILKVREYSKT